MEIIQSKQNASIKTARKLLQRKHRKTSYLLEGWHLFEEAKASGADILQIFVLEEMADRVANMMQTLMFLGLAFVEVLALLGFVLAFIK